MKTVKKSGCEHFESMDVNTIKEYVYEYCQNSRTLSKNKEVNTKHRCEYYKRICVNTINVYEHKNFQRNWVLILSILSIKAIFVNAKFDLSSLL